MRSKTWGLALGAIALAACQVNAPTGGKRPTVTVASAPAVGNPPLADAKASALPGPAASQAPAGQGSSPQAQVVSLLAAPPSAAASLSGVLRLDAAYVVAAGGGNVIAAGGGNVIAAGGGNVIAAGGGNVVAAGGGNVIAAGGGNILAAGAGNLLASGGGQIVASGGGNVVAAGGGNVIAAGGGNYRLAGAPNFHLQADAAASAEALPAAGVVVGLIDLRSGRLVPVGVDHQGQAVEAIYTNATGAFTLHPPADTQGNLAIVARLPGAERDPRLAYDRITSSKASASPQPQDLDEATALATRYLIQSTESRMEDLLRRIHEADPDDPRSLKDIASSFNSSDPSKNSLIRCLIQEVKSRMGQGAPSPEAYAAVARRQTRLLVASFDLADLTCRQHAGDMPKGQRFANPEVVNRYFGEAGVLPVMTEALKRANERVALRAQALGGLRALEAIPELQATGVVFLKPSDVGQAIVDRSYANEALIQAGRARGSFQALGFSEEEAKELDNAMRSVASGLAVAIGNLMLGGLMSGDPSFLRQFLDNVGPSAQADPLASFTGCLLGQAP